MTTWRISLACGVALLCSGCVLPRCDIAPQYRGTAYQNVGPVHSPRLVNIEVEHHVFGLNSYFRAKRIRPEVVRGLTASNVFVEADDTNRDQAGKLLVVVKEHLEPKRLAKAYVNGAISGWSLGLISTETEASYDMNVTYTPPNGDPSEWTGHHPYVITSGIESWEKNENTVPVMKVPSELAEGMAARFAQEFWAQNSGTDYADAAVPTMNLASPSRVVTRLPAATVAPEVIAPPSVIQSAATKSPTTNIVR